MYYFLLWNLPKERHESAEKAVGADSLPDEADRDPEDTSCTPTACRPSSWQLLKSNLEGEVVTSQRSAGKRRAGPGPFTVRVGVTV